MSLFESASLVVTPNGTKASKLYAIKPTSGAGDLTVVRATTARRVNSAGLIESVAVNVPRLDYTNSTCPSILVEPQRTNLALYSEQFDNAFWNKFNGLTVTANNAISPDGTQNSDTLNVSNNSNLLYAVRNGTFTGNTYTFSLYAKGSGNFTMNIRLNSSTIITETKTLTSQWQRFTVTVTNAVPIISIEFFLELNTSSTYNIWGAQAEEGSYATSYIPTVASSVTRNADVISKTGISSLIGQTEGTLFYDGIFGNASDEVYLFLQASASATVENSIYIQKRPGSIIALSVWTNTITQQVVIQGGSFTVGQRIKIAAAYKNNDFVLYVNGVQIGTDNLGSVPNCGKLFLSCYGGNPTDELFIANRGSKISALWQTRLSNTELIELTTL